MFPSDAVSTVGECKLSAMATTTVKLKLDGCTETKPIAAVTGSAPAAWTLLAQLEVVVA